MEHDNNAAAAAGSDSLLGVVDLQCGVRFRATVLARVAAFALALVASVAYAQDDIEAVWAAVADAAITGPERIDLRSYGNVGIDANQAFVPRPAADRLMASMGNQVGDEFLGLILPTTDAAWFVTVDYVDSGYIPDDEALDWDVDELLDSLKAGTREGNRWREQNGFAPIEVTGWVETPHYDASSHQLVWSAGVKDEGAPASPNDTINYNTYVLGREGYLSLNLVTDMQAIAGEKRLMGRLLGDTSFRDGMRYEDFNPNTDRVAAYGIAALVGGIAAKKLGLLAGLAALLLKGWKLLLIGVIGIGSVFRRFFGSKTT